jgi:hypothetical protein
MTSEARQDLIDGRVPVIEQLHLPALDQCRHDAHFEPRDLRSTSGTISPRTAIRAVLA